MICLVKKSFHFPVVRPTKLQGFALNCSNEMFADFHRTPVSQELVETNSSPRAAVRREVDGEVKTFLLAKKTVEKQKTIWTFQETFYSEEVPKIKTWIKRERQHLSLPVRMAENG